MINVIKNFIIYISPLISMVATAVIAFYAWRSYELSQQIKNTNDLKIKGDQEFREQLSDLYQAITISTLLSGPSSTGAFDRAISAFKSQYKGKTPIFS
jgi:hypothetical protein